jgi:hypothetical protein
MALIYQLSSARRILLTAVAVLALAPAAAYAASVIDKHQSATVTIPAGQTRTLAVPFPDALKYANASYRGTHIVTAPAQPAGAGRPPDLHRVRVLSSHSILGGSEFQVRVRNANPAGTAAVRLRITATTVEPLPHH